MRSYEDYSDQEYQLHEILGWALLGLIGTVNVDRPALFGGFLHDLFLDPRGGDLGGEPGWALERIELNEDFEAKYAFFSDECFKSLRALKLNGDDQAFWIDIQGQVETVASSSIFWKVVRDSFEDFVAANPERAKEFTLICEQFPQLTRD